MNDLASLRSAIEAELTAFINLEISNLAQVDEELKPVAEALSDYILGGGKRIRPIFALVGYLGAGGKIDKKIVRAIASLELLQACALIHDDLIDGSDNRRGKPSIHKAFEKLHLQNNRSGSASNFGAAAAILLGDLALVWSDKCIHDSGIETKAQLAVNPIHDAMRIEIMAGQYLDVLEQSLSNTSVERALKIARFKSGKYTIERPLHFGLKLNPTHNPNLQKVFTDYGIPLGEAFQLRDDVLGIFGNPDETGKPAGDDLREGKRTVLMAKALELSNSDQRKSLLSALGKNDLSTAEVKTAQEIIKNTGALTAIEQMISDLSATAAKSISEVPITDDGRKLLTNLIELSTKRKI